MYKLLRKNKSQTPSLIYFDVTFEALKEAGPHISEVPYIYFQA